MWLRMVLVCALGYGSLGCGDGGGGDGELSGLLEALNGDYRIREGTDCVIAIRGSSFGTRMSTGATKCVEEYDDGEREELEVSGTLTDTQITGTLKNDESYPDVTQNGCELRALSRREATLTATKTMSRTSEGRFAGLAGTWEGHVDFVRSQAELPCDGPEDVYDQSTSENDFTAEVYGDLITITYQREFDEDTVEVVESASGDLIVEGETFLFNP